MSTPIAKTAGARAVVERYDTLVSCVPSGAVADPETIFRACVKEANACGGTPQSVVEAAYVCCAIGMPPGKAWDLIHFVPRGNKIAAETTYKAYVHAAFANQFLASLHSDYVLDGEPFDYHKDETGPKLRHEVKSRTEAPDIRKIVASYCIYATTSGGNGVTVVWAPEFPKPSQRGPVWKSYPGPMACKTAVRRARREWMCNGTLLQMDSFDSAYESGVELPVPEELRRGEDATESIDDIMAEDAEVANDE